MSTQSTEEGPDEVAEKRFNAATTREEKLAVLKDYMSDNQAESLVGRLLGEHDGDMIDLSKPKR